VSWISTGSDRTVILVMGAELPTGRHDFVATVIDHDTSVLTKTGSCLVTEDSLMFRASLEFALHDEPDKPVGERTGSTRRRISETWNCRRRLEEGRLDLEGIPPFPWNGSFRELFRYLQQVDLDDVSPTCALSLANAAIITSQARIPGFNSNALIQYISPATFNGVVSGQVTIALSNITHPLTEITYANFSDFAGVVLDGRQSTLTTFAGDGYMFGTVTFRFYGSGGSTGAPLMTGTVSYGTVDGTGNSVQISGGNPVSGAYVVSLDWGPVTPLPVEVLNVCDLTACPPF
jgi:hypothetical protein